MNKPKAYIKSIIFSGDDQFKFRENEKVILVGPNNSGKSQTLREIISIASDGKTEKTLVIKNLEIEKIGSADDLKNFLKNEAEYVGSSYRYKNWELPETHLGFWAQNYLMHGILNGFLKNIDANNRLKICEQQNSIDPGSQKTKPQHILYDDEKLMKKMTALFRKAFGKDLMFDFRGGSKLPIHVGQLPEMLGTIDRVGDNYVQAIRSQPLLNKQGDGMKSYAGILFEALVSNLDITLIDEPEAFLHPPQMRRLGETLSSEVKGQLIVSTHSSDILRGFLEGTRGDIRILRIQRELDKNFVSEAPQDAIKELWNKPELRYSNALDGIFHEQTIICEDDSDCRLINSVADHLSNEGKEQWKDTAYVPTGGKHGVPKVASVLHKIGVPIKAVFDIDFLSEKSLVQLSVDAFGGEWDQIEPIWTRVDAAVSNGVKPKSPEDIKQDIIDIINGAKPEELPRGDISEAMKQGTSWNLVKKFGVLGIPKGQAQIDYDTLRIKLENIGIYIIPVGEIENFCREIGKHGPKFVTKVLSEVPLGDTRLSELRNFVQKVHNGPASARKKCIPLPAKSH